MDGSLCVVVHAKDTTGVITAGVVGSSPTEDDDDDDD
jgi:hypothetical protein